MPAKYAVKVCQAKGLSMYGQKPDAYVKLKLGSQTKQKTKNLKGFDPVWNEWFDFNRWGKDETLLIEVMHYNTLNSNIMLGKVTLKLPTDKTGHFKGVLNLRLNKNVAGKGARSSLAIEVVDIAVKQRNAERQTSVSNEEGEKLIRKMMQGSEWTLHEINQKGKKKRREVLLFYSEDTSDGHPIGSILWVSPDTDSIPIRSDLSGKHQLAVHTITDVFIGPPCSHASYLTGINTDLCVTFKGEKKWNMVASTEEVQNIWLKGLRYAISSKGKKCASVDVKGNESSSSDSKKKSNPTSWENPANEAVQKMLDGCEMVAYFCPKSPRKENVFVWFARGGGKYGSIYWSGGSGSKREDPGRCILLHQLTDIYVGKQQEIFQGPIASDVEDQCCFSIVSKRSGKKIELHIQAQSVEVMKTWMVGINHILTTTGRKVVLESETGEKKSTATGRRFSRHFSVAVRAKSTNPGVLKMADGAYFTRYRQKKSKKDRSVKTQVFVFHSRLGGASDLGKAPTGALFWYEKTDKEKELEERKKDRRCIPVHSITDIYCGKQHNVFQTKVACDAKDDCVFSIKGVEVSKGNKNDFLLHLEAESPEVVKTWMDAITHLLQGGGRTVEQVGDDQNQEGAPNPEQPKKKRLSIKPPTNDPLDMFGFNEPAAKSEELDGFFPSSQPANPFDTAGEWDPFQDSPAPAPAPAPAPTGGDDLSSFFGNDAPSIQQHVPVLAQAQDSVWGSEGTDPFSAAPPSNTQSTPSFPSTDIFGASDDFGTAPPQSNDPFGAPSQSSDPFGAPQSDDPFGAPPQSSDDPFGAPSQSSDPFGAPSKPVQQQPDFGDIFGATPAPSQTISSTQNEGLGEMTRFLMSIGLKDYVKKFEAEQVDMDALRMFSKDDLKDMGVPKGPTIKILKTIPNWKG